MLYFMSLIESPEVVGRLKYVAGALAVVMPFMFGLAALWLDKKQAELIDARRKARTFSAEEKNKFVAVVRALPRDVHFGVYALLTRERL